MLDVDYLMTCYPTLDVNFGPAHYEYLTKLVRYNIDFHSENGFDCFIINYVFDQKQLADLMFYLHKHTPGAAVGGIFCFCLWTHHTSILLSNVQKRALPNLEWESKRAVELHRQMSKIIGTRKLGERIFVHDNDGQIYQPQIICQNILDKIDEIISPNTQLESIDFNPRFIDWILDGSKTATTRKFKQERQIKWRQGNSLLALNAETKKPFAVLRLSQIMTVEFGDLTAELAKTENFENLVEFKQVLQDIYPDISVTGDKSLMHVFYFTTIHYL